MDRLIKYTGYGNAAGLLASRGLMTGQSTRINDYSSDSDDSDTEEYDKLKDKWVIFFNFYINNNTALFI